MPALPNLELICFGPPNARLGGSAPPQDVLWRKPFTLLVYLALSPDLRREREHLIGLFWSEKDQGRARQNLNEALRKLRKSLTPNRLPAEGTQLRIEGAGLEVDALRFDALAQRAPRDAARLYRGSFLEGLHIDAAEELEAWISAERRRFALKAAEVFSAVAEEELLERAYPAAADYARRALALEPHGEKAVRALMRALALAGDPSAALAAYHEFVERLERELHERPGKKLIEQAEQIRKQAIKANRSPEQPRDPVLVGRATVYREAFETLNAGLSGSARVIVATGAPGMGRTRLLAECSRRAEQDGAFLAIARPLEQDHDARWSTLRMLLHGSLAAAPGLPATRPEALAVLASLAPELPVSVSPREPRDTAEVAAALSALLTAISEENPLVLAIDDAHWADGASLAALRAALAGLGAARVVWIVTSATGVGEPPAELQQILAEVRRGLPGVHARLDKLEDADVAALVRAEAGWCTDDTERDRLTRRVAHEAGGNPLFAATLLRALERFAGLRKDLTVWPFQGSTITSPLPFSVPDLVRHAVELRVGELSKEDVPVLCAASIGALGLDLDLMTYVAERSWSDIERALPALERRQLITFDGERYVFVAPLVAEVVRSACLTKGERRRLERRAIDALATRDDLESRVLRAELLARVAPDAAAFAFVLAACRDARASGASRLARRAAAAGERIAAAAGLDRAELDRVR